MGAVAKRPASARKETAWYETMIMPACLTHDSIPGYYRQVKRAQSVTVKGRDLNGKEMRIKAEDILAQALEHEIDHLNGTLYVDHLESLDQLSKTRQEEAES